MTYIHKKALHLAMRGFRVLVGPWVGPVWLPGPRRAYMKDGISGASIWVIVRLPAASKKNKRPAKRLSGS